MVAPAHTLRPGPLDCCRPPGADVHISHGLWVNITLYTSLYVYIYIHCTCTIHITCNVNVPSCVGLSKGVASVLMHQPSRLHSQLALRSCFNVCLVGLPLLLQAAWERSVGRADPSIVCYLQTDTLQYLTVSYSSLQYLTVSYCILLYLMIQSFCLGTNWLERRTVKLAGTCQSSSAALLIAAFEPGHFLCRSGLCQLGGVVMGHLNGL